MVIGSVAFFQDLRKIKELEKELLRSERLAAVGQTVAFMAHEIKNILHGFKGGSHILKSGLARNDSAKLKTGWEMMQRNIDRISELALDLLSYSKEREPEYESCFPNEIAGDVCELFADLAVEHEIELKKEFEAIIGEVVMDPRTIHRALTNLVSNAIDACIADEESNKQHWVSVSTALENGNVVRFGVKDNGSGMDENVKANLFKSFFSTKGAKGTGLGLLVTKKLIEEHRGTIDVASQFGKGTTFSIRLPFEALSAD
jgi:signal transduction histidine kinase